MKSITIRLPLSQIHTIANSTNTYDYNDDVDYDRIKHIVAHTILSPTSKQQY